MDAAALTGSLAACAVMAGAAALTGWRIDAVSRRDGGADDYFWTAFGGILVILGAGVVAGALGGAGAVMAVGVGIASPLAAVIWARRRHGRRARVARESARTAAWEDLCRRHDAVVRRWAEYDVDPAKAIRYPGMHDPGHPAARSIIHALRAAGAERPAGPGSADSSAGSSADPQEMRGYADAVARLEHALALAEQDIGAYDLHHPARHRAVTSGPEPSLNRYIPARS
ncbi:hypothetical protein [Arthrobacter sedimenti]|uniref:hypothetical protein n=1 Tax=Arthrobacter sedimenti TaxID=2694931 RepID=UPI000B34DA99|nr:hypothetical protein [Arthrobacter sedimenti]OUM43859.1 hypothetical protein B8W73_04045 [Arthrobacter agilis]